jgi:plastocyanin
VGSSAAAADPSAALYEVEIAQFLFTPERLEITAGDSVAWINSDPVPHTATAAAGDWDSGNLDRSAHYSTRFEDPGTYTYICRYHPLMRGEIVVRP